MRRVYRGQQPLVRKGKKKKQQTKPMPTNQPKQTGDTEALREGAGKPHAPGVCGSPLAHPLLAPSAPLLGVSSPGVGTTIQTVVSVAVFSKNHSCTPQPLTSCPEPGFFPSSLGPQGDTIHCSLEDLNCSIPSSLPVSSPQHDKCLPHPKLDGNSHVLLGSGGKSLDLGQ